MARSNLERQLDLALREVFPYDPIISDKPIKVRGKTLYIDRAIQRMKVAVEADGIQHSEFTEHFHGDRQGFEDSKLRDKLKAEWLEANGWTLIRFSSKEKITAAAIRIRLLEIM